MTREDKLRKAIEEYIGYAYEVDECINTTKQRIAFADGANWQYHQFIEKACEYLKSLVYQEFGGGPLERTFSDEDIEEFKKAIEE